MMADGEKRAPALDVGFMLAVGEIPPTEVVGGIKDGELEEGDTTFEVPWEEVGEVVVAGGALEPTRAPIQLC